MPGQAGLLEATEARDDIIVAPEKTAADGAAGRRPHSALLLTLAGAGVLLLAAAAAVAWVRHDDRHAAPRPAVALPLLTVDPPAGTRGVHPAAKVTIRPNRGRLSSVRVVDGGGNEVAGTMAPLGRSWESTAPLALARDYKVTTHVLGVGKRPVVRTSEFATIRPAALLDPSITPGDRETVGVAAPIVVRFQAPVANRNAVTQALLVSMSRPVDGAWHWFNPREVHYRPREYWPVGQQVTVVAKLTNVEAGNNVWGSADRSMSFTVGDAHVTTVDTDAHTMTVTANGSPLRTVPQSSGREKYPTMGGVHIVLHKAYHVVMDSSTVGIPVSSADGYREDVYWNVAITNGGEYVHAAPWSTRAQGSRNVSHGCVNLSTSDARWFYNFSQYGDVVHVLGSQRAPSGSDAGTVDWNIPWEQWLQPIA
jgi:lipoprotein-anchoring transpeptidase ErfK/SrfK